ncbi:MAG: TIGR01777 family oxidoreductase [Pseudomonadota bacterium]
MNITITGASGFVGTHLSRALIEKGHRVTGIGTSRVHRYLTHDLFDWVSADTTREGDWQESVRSADVVVNLTGKTIFGYWSKAYKDDIYNSRVMTTRHIVEALGGIRPGVLLSTSAIGYYGNRGDDELTEEAAPGSDFLARVCRDWEAAASKAEEKGVRVVLMRFGVVLGPGGALEKMIPAFRFFAGGPLGSGAHWFPWIHMEDIIRAMDMFMDQNTINGPVNLCSPGAIRHRDFARALGRALNRPSFMPAPAFMVRMIMGEMGGALLSSQRAIPQVLLDSGFEFGYDSLEKALKNLV